MYLAVYSTQAKPLTVTTASTNCREFMSSARSERLRRHRKIQPAACAVPAHNQLSAARNTAIGERTSLVAVRQRLLRALCRNTVIRNTTNNTPYKEKLSMRRKAMKPIVIAVVLAAVLVLTGLPQAQSASVNLKQLAALNAKTSTQAATAAGDPLAVGICILSAANQNLAKLNACNDDIVCKSAVLLDALLEILVCTNPDDQNLALYECISNAIVAIAEIKSTCGEDRACSLPKIIPVVLGLANCFGQGNTTAGK
jgi:hypothetical protein